MGQEETLQDLKITSFDEEIFSMSRAKLKENFSYKSGGIESSRLIRNLIWQDRGFIAEGRLAKFKGNVRSYWYSRVKPVLDRARAKRFADKYDMMIRQFKVMIIDRRLMDYADFGFADESAHQRRLGKDNGHIWCIAEKAGHMALLEEIQRHFGATIYVLGGQPSALGSENFARMIEEAGVEREDVLVVMLVDYDPSGMAIAKSFLYHLSQLGLSELKPYISLVHPSRMTHEQIRLNRFRLPNRKSQRTKNRQWANQTGGLSAFGFGELYGLEVDAMTWDQLIEGFGQAVADTLQTPIEVLTRRRLEHELVAVLKTTLLERLLRPR